MYKIHVLSRIMVIDVIVYYISSKSIRLSHSINPITNNNVTKTVKFVVYLKIIGSSQKLNEILNYQK